MVTLSSDLRSVARGQVRVDVHRWDWPLPKPRPTPPRIPPPCPPRWDAADASAAASVAPTDASVAALKDATLIEIKLEPLLSRGGCARAECFVRVVYESMHTIGHGNTAQGGNLSVYHWLTPFKSAQLPLATVAVRSVKRLDAHRATLAIVADAHAVLVALETPSALVGVFSDNGFTMLAGEERCPSLHLPLPPPCPPPPISTPPTRSPYNNP